MNKIHYLCVMNVKEGCQISNILSIHKVKFTKPQKYVVDKFLDGWRLTRVNTHHMSGGQYMWVSPYSSSLQDAGHVYKAFHNIFWTIKKQTGIEINLSEYVV